MPRHEFVVATENIPYLAWQAMLFHYSCVRHMGVAPIIVVHKDDEPLHPGFERIQAAGGQVQTAPNYRIVNGVYYPPRNTAGTLRHVQTDAEYIVLCDSDMIFLQPLPLKDLLLKPRQVSFDFVSYLVPDGPQYQPYLDNICRSVGVDPKKLRTLEINGGVPHVIPTRWQQPLSNEWFELMSLFPNEPLGEGCQPQSVWLAATWSIVIAMHRLKLKPVMTRFCTSNAHESQPLPSLTPDGPKMLHYCYGGSGFNKRDYFHSIDAEQNVWAVPPDDGTIAGAIRQHLRDARQFYGL